MKFKNFLLIWLIAVLASLPVFAMPSSLVIQGYLTDSSSTPVSNGTYNITLKLYALATGGTALFSQTQSVLVENGIFEFDPTDLTAEAIDFNQAGYLGISIGSDPELSPRIRLVSSPWSLLAGNISGESVWLRNADQTSMTISMTGTNSIGLYAKAYSNAIFGSSEASPGEGVSGHTTGANSAGVLGQGLSSQATGVMAVNLAATAGYTQAGSALYIGNRFIIDRERGVFPKPAGWGCIPGGGTTNSVDITNSLASDNSVILLTVYDPEPGTLSANNKGGVKVSSITNDEKFVVSTMDNTVTNDPIYFYYLIINN